MAQQPIFTGAGVAIVTPFDKYGNINYEKLGELIERQIAGGTDAIIICGTTGESATLSPEERKAVIRFTVENDCTNFSPEMLRTIFFRYRRVPSVTDGKTGLGLGIPMIQAIASIHKGSVLVTVPAPGKVRFCLSFPVRQDYRGTLRSSALRLDYAGGFDRSLLELSDVLPSDAFE